MIETSKNGMPSESNALQLRLHLVCHSNRSEPQAEAGALSSLLNLIKPIMRASAFCSLYKRSVSDFFVQRFGFGCHRHKFLEINLRSPRDAWTREKTLR